jgi:hypothetical protein
VVAASGCRGRRTLALIVAVAEAKRVLSLTLRGMGLTHCCHDHSTHAKQTKEEFKHRCAVFQTYYYYYYSSKRIRQENNLYGHYCTYLLPALAAYTLGSAFRNSITLCTRFLVSENVRQPINDLRRL